MEKEFKRMIGLLFIDEGERSSIYKDDQHQRVSIKTSIV